MFTGCCKKGQRYSGLDSLTNIAEQPFKPIYYGNYSFVCRCYQSVNHNP